MNKGYILDQNEKEISTNQSYSKLEWEKSKLQNRIRHRILLQYEIVHKGLSSVEGQDCWFRKMMLTGENQDGGIGRHTAPPRTTRTDRKIEQQGSPTPSR